MSKKNYDELADKLLVLVGEKENINNLTHCVTRLRFNLKDRGVVELNDINKIEGVLGSQWSGDQLQVIIGQNVNDAYSVTCRKAGLEEEKPIDENLDANKCKFSIYSVITAIAECITPLVSAILAAGMLKVLVMLLTNLGILSVESSTYTILSLVADAIFYFLPIFVGATAAKKFGCSLGLGMAIGAILLSPTFISLVSSGNPITVFGLPVSAVNYSNTIFPTIICVFGMSYIVKFLSKHCPNSIRSVLVPVITLLLMIPLALCFLAPLGNIIGTLFSTAVMWINGVFGPIAVAIMGALMPLLILTGMHSCLTPYFITAMMTVGKDALCIANFISNFSQGGAALAISLKTKNTNMKSIAVSGAVSAIVGGVTEPVLYTIIVKYKTAMLASVVSGAAAGLFAGLTQVYCYAFPGSTGLFGMPIFIGPVGTNLIFAIISIIIGFIISFAMTYILYKDDSEVA